MLDQQAECLESGLASAEPGLDGVLTEIDLKTTLKDKLDVDVAPQVILGACRPPLAYEAIQVDPSIAAVLPPPSVPRPSALGRSRTGTPWSPPVSRCAWQTTELSGKPPTFNPTAAGKGSDTWVV